VSSKKDKKGSLKEVGGGGFDREGGRSFCEPGGKRGSWRRRLFADWPAEERCTLRGEGGEHKL